MSMLGMLMGSTAAAGGASMEKVFQSSASSATDLTTYTFSGIDFAAGEVLVVITGTFSAGTSRTVSSVTVGGSAATVETTKTNNSGGGITVARISLAAGTSGAVVVTWSGSVTSCAIAVYRVTGRTNAGAASVGSYSAAITIATSATLSSIAIPEGGFLLAAIVMQSNPTVTQTGLTLASDAILTPDSYRQEAKSSAIQAAAISGGSVGWSWAGNAAGIAAAFAFSG